MPVIIPGNNLQSLGMTQLEIKANDEAASEAEEKSKVSCRNSCSSSEGTLEVTRANIHFQNGTKATIEDIDMKEEIDTCESPVWVAGTVIFITGSLLNFVAFAFAPQSILASLEGIQVSLCPFDLLAVRMRLSGRGEQAAGDELLTPCPPPPTSSSRMCYSASSFSGPTSRTSCTGARR